MENKNLNYTNIPIPNMIVDKIREHIKNTEFNSAADYIIFILQEVLGDKNNSPAELTPEEEEEVKKNLKKLGYL